MAGRGKTVVYQVDVESNDAWYKDLEHKGLMIVELYSDWFGYTEVLTPQIAEIMKKVGEEAGVEWRRVNVLNLEAEKREILANEKKGKSETASEEDEQHVIDENDFLVKGLERFKGFCSPQPFFIFFKKGIIYDILRACNPPLLETLIMKYLEDGAEPSTTIDWDVNLRTPEEIAAEKAAIEADRQHIAKLMSIVETVECEDPMKLTVEEVTLIFAMFVGADDAFLGKVEEEETKESIIESLGEKSVDDVVMYFKKSLTMDDIAEWEKAVEEKIAEEKRLEEEAETKRLAEEAAAKEAEDENVENDEAKES